ncbi:MAG TPA: YCF48-related protein [Ignavibacteria bacterium]|nr:YCF48-related protein [Ignavibacteria bacterium]
MRINIFTLTAFCLSVVFILSGKTMAQGFNSITTPDGVNITAVGNSGKIYRSVNSGTTWTNFINGASNLYCVTSLNNDVWISSANGNILKTQKTASPVITYNTGSTNNLYSISFIDANTGFVCGDAGTVYKTINGGVNWTSSNSGIASVKLNSISFDNASVGTVAGNNGTIYVTSDGGSSWVSEVSGSNKNILKLKYFSGNIIAVGEYGTLLSNDGSGWTSIDSRILTDIRGVTGTSINDVHLCGGGGFIRNNKSGSSKFTNFEVNPMMANLVDIFYYDANNGWAVSSLNSVIIYTTNAGATWSMPSGATMTKTWVSKLVAGGGIGNNLCMHPFNRDAMFVVYGSTVYRSGNRGDNWTNIASITGGGNAHSFYVSPIDTNIWLTAITGSPDKVKRTTNYGATWTDVLSANFSNYGQPLEMDQNNPNNYYFAPDGGGFYRSTDNGASFTEISGNFPFRSPCDIIVTWDSSNVILVGDGVTGSGQAKIFKSVNGGVNWTDMYTVASSETPAICNSVFERGTFYSTEWSGSGYYKTTNYGDNWALTGTTGSSGWGTDLCHEDPTLVLKGTYGSPTYLTTNSGLTFSSTSVGGGAGAGIIVPERGYLIAMQVSGLFKMNIVYTDAPVVATIDVQATSNGLTGVQYFPAATITPTGTVKNNNGTASATFTVTRKITPGNYISTKTVNNLAASASANVTFDNWTFNSGTTYTVSDSVYIFNDVVPANDVLTGSITPYVGQSSALLNEGFSGAFPPTNWTFQFSGTNYWKNNNSVSSYGSGTGSSYYNFWSAGRNTGSQSLISAPFSASVNGDSIAYDYAYSPYTGSTDTLIIEASTNGGTTYTVLAQQRGNTAFAIGADSSLNTVAASGSQFTPTSGQWRTRKFKLPVGSNKVRFRARSDFGNDLYVDSIRISSGSLYTQFNVKLVPEGLYNGTSKIVKDTVRIYLRNSNAPFALVDSSITLIDDITLISPCVFKNAPTGSYYLQAIHRNSLEVWSKTNGVNIINGVFGSYDFTSGVSQTFGDNAVLVNTSYCIPSGDVNQDGIIDAGDLSNVENDVALSNTGYILTDLNGDEFADAADLSIVENNVMISYSVVRP